ncbi:MAG: hypothetical protein JSV39_01600 [Candidatus Aenigmatarchaeota archaeon]|nr:MAG: hypothetical protein JSV39_01600 [Candidatus Aenigmarchaeota archaeon]
MLPATTWNGLQDLLYKSGIPADYEVPYGKLETNVLLDTGKVLLKHSLLSYNEYGGSFHENPESTTGTISKEKIRIIADQNEIIYQFLPCNTLRRFCDYLSETSGLEPRPSGKNIKIPNISVIGDGGNAFNGTLIGFNKKEKIIRVLLNPELLAKPFLNFPFEEHSIREIRREGEIVYSSSPLKKEDVFGASYFK